MKYIKLFEKNERGYWKIRTDSPYYEISLDKIKMPKRIQSDFLSGFKRKFIKNTKYVYIENNSNWEWTCFESLVKDMKNLGEIQITPEEIEEWKFKNTVNNYNL